MNASEIRKGLRDKFIKNSMKKRYFGFARNARGLSGFEKMTGENGCQIIAQKMTFSKFLKNFRKTGFPKKKLLGNYFPGG